ncbi:hypothetical protein KQX54_012404 [Cotesia glomerata]|uniref:HAT C-terminal dimerisation domain-containing protein n=1 Tax=Cotesia glomerata TaxID=32391 RepID=A0AAV7I307_COTGL|nr:hypothetical protein KQX54_012404 [Cotesia glomerata]
MSPCLAKAFPDFEIAKKFSMQKAQKFSKKSLQDVLIRFPILKDYVNSQALDQEWREHALLDYEKLGLDSDQIAEKYWIKVFNLKNKLGATLFPNLKIVMRLLLALPFSNASVERVFSALKICKTDLRNRMDTATIVNSLVIRESIEKDGGCKAFNPYMAKKI